MARRGSSKNGVWRTIRRAAELARPAHAAVLIRDLMGKSQPLGESRAHLEQTMAWLCRAQDQSGGAGVSAGYSLLNGWLPPYPETTGYIIPTFFNYSARTGREDLRNRAVRMAEWEIEIQLPSGAVQSGQYYGPGPNRPPAVFNTGQVILGWCRAFSETNREVFLQAASRAADWLLQVQSEDGAWRVAAPETETQVHAYDVRTAWSLLELQTLTGESRYGEAARHNLDWALRQQRENGWFENNAFFVSRGKWNLPLTHTIAYVLEGFFEAWRLLRDNRYWDALQKPAQQLLQIFERRGFLPGEFDDAWESSSRYTCLTGNAQIAGVWLSLFEHTQDVRFLNAAQKLNDSVKSAQSLRPSHPGIRGGVKGSQPIYGRYTPFVFINWGAKFLADSLMLEEKVTERLERRS